MTALVNEARRNGGRRVIVHAHGARASRTLTTIALGGVTVLAEYYEARARESPRSCTESDPRDD